MKDMKSKTELIGIINKTFQCWVGMISHPWGQNAGILKLFSSQFLNSKAYDYDFDDRVF